MGGEGFSDTKLLLRKFKYTGLKKNYIPITVIYPVFSNTVLVLNTP